MQHQECVGGRGEERGTTALTTTPTVVRDRSAHSGGPVGRFDVGREEDGADTREQIHE